MAESTPEPQSQVDEPVTASDNVTANTSMDNTAAHTATDATDEAPEDPEPVRRPTGLERKAGGEVFRAENKLEGDGDGDGVVTKKPDLVQRLRAAVKKIGGGRKGDGQ